MNVQIFDECLQRCFAYKISTISDIIPRTIDGFQPNDILFSVERRLTEYYVDGGVIYRNDDETFSEYIERIF